MNFEQYRMKPLPPQKKPIWKVLAFGVIAFLLIAMFVFMVMNQRIICEGTGGRWVVFPETIAINKKEHPNSRPNYEDYWPADKKEALGMCIR
jgi:hypothetical protein